MSKYKLTFKAEDIETDAFLPIEARAREWMKNHGWLEDHVETYGKPPKYASHFVYHNKSHDIRFVIVIVWSVPTPPAIYKTDTYGDMLLFTKEELKFFDIMNYEVSRYHEEKTGQTITDWF